MWPRFLRQFNTLFLCVGSTSTSKNEPKTGPRGTPYGAVPVEWVTATGCVLSLTNDAIQSRTVSLSLKCRRSRKTRSEWSTQLNTAVKSNKPNSVTVVHQKPISHPRTHATSRSQRNHVYGMGIC